ncbi:MAG TPA: hypothetical protein VNT75_29085, partial [Symbiobacteriaceae bacterium]|nr:hypothetical protein [Symbiobacteriaceae bacterium]
LNSCLRRQAPQVTEVDPGVLEAFLRVGRYRHGSRSLETIVRMSALAGKQKFELSSLPPDNVLGMHVPAAEFTALTRRAYARPLRVGITGHINLDPARMEELENGVARAVGYLSQLYPDRALTVFSPMAVGADRLVARELLKQPGARLIAVLPVPAEDYINDFGTTDDHAADYSGAELRQEFRHWLTNRACEVIEMGPTPTRDEAYRQAGYEVAGHCHVLMAVWDGQGAQGVGGTAEIVARAAQRGVPVIHVWAGNHKKDPTRRTTVGEKHGQFRTLNFPGQEPGVWSSER